MSRSSRGARLAAITAVAALALAACGGGSGDPAPSDAPAPAPGAFPVTVEHVHGTTEIPAEPKRVVTLGLSDHEAVLALGVKPVGVVDWFKERPFGSFPWQQPLWGDTRPEIVGERDEYNAEKIAALAPDLIIAQYSGMNREQYDTLSQLAPVVAQPKEYPLYGAPWQNQTERIGTALGKSAEAEELISDIDAKFAAVRAEHPEWARQTGVVADSFKPGVYSVFQPQDPKMVFLSELGFTLPDAIEALVDPQSNVVEFGAEKLEVLDADKLVWVTSDQGSEDRIKNEQLYQKLKVVQEGRDVFLSYSTPPIGAAISFNTVLSVPYAIDQAVPLIAAKTK
ncbi:iron-siderophore ABC transporter substrate-binding protein [Umezawaea beigongshangensis]|uniref:iron-siderophore ABC transporter substrate-binding protein n=1 Tax=Umezawaea beigongshangensis TaxID=2780383 RepID=UPI0018F1EC99|nr:iron-siderophore ABC transporter substrate-binding protein [Umezawaea beigongshangensis]